MRFRNIILTTMISIIAGIILFFGVFSVQQYEKALTGRVIRDYQETADIMGNNVKALIMYMEDFSKSIALNDFVVDSIEKYRSVSDENRLHDMADLRYSWDRFSNTLFYSTSMIYNVDLYSDKDLIYSYHDLQWDTENSVIPGDMIEQALDQASPLWTELLSLRQMRKYNKNDEYGFAVVKSVRNNKARVIGCIALYVKESSFSSLLGVMNHDNQSCFLVDSQDRIVSAADRLELSANIAGILDLTGVEYRKCTENGSLLKKKKGEAPALYITQDITDTNLRLVCEIRLTDLAEQTAKMRMMLWILGAVAVGIAFIGAGIASRRITFPLEKLMLVMEQIKEGSGKNHVRFQEKNAGEIGILGEQFNELMDQLDASGEKILQEQRRLWHNEVRLLQAQIIPHFLYNTLGVISSMIRLGMKDEAIDAVQKLATFYRLSLSNGKEIISIREEVELTHSYMELQKQRYIEYMEYSIEYDDTIGDRSIPKLTIQPLVENVLHHGLRNDGRKCNILVSITENSDNDGVLIRVWDDGIGISAKRLEELRTNLEINAGENDSFGISNIHQRLKMYYGEGYRMEIHSEENCYTEILLYLPRLQQEPGTNALGAVQIPFEEDFTNK